VDMGYFFAGLGHDEEPAARTESSVVVRLSA
jgi:hypothetical protein